MVSPGSLWFLLSSLFAIPDLDFCSTASQFHNLSQAFRFTLSTLDMALSVLVNLDPGLQ